MPNVVCSIGYELEKLHTGMIVYLCDLWGNGQREPLEAFCSSLNVDLRDYELIEPRREHENIDLVLHDQSKNPFLAIEMKVHNHESKVPVKGGNGIRDYQTRVYPQRLPTCKRFLFVTLGVGEYFHRPYGEGKEGVEWVRLDRFLEAVRAAGDADVIIRDWAKALAQEKEFQNACREGNASVLRNDGQAREARRWNLYFLGFLREQLERSSTGSDLVLHAYAHGRTDTILNFGQGQHYLEINQNGRLNLKVNLEQVSEQSAKQRRLQDAASQYRQIFAGCGDEDRQGTDELKKTKRIWSFDIGIVKRGQEGYFVYRDGGERTKEQILELVDRFRSAPSFAS